jgi:hypothetical protein
LQEDNIELLIVSDNLDQEYLERLVKKVARMIRRNILYSLEGTKEYVAQNVNRDKDKYLLLWQQNHLS